MELNVIENIDELWLPTLRIQDGKDSLALLDLRDQNLKVLKRGVPIPDDDSFMREGNYRFIIFFFLSFFRANISSIMVESGNIFGESGI